MLCIIMDTLLVFEGLFSRCHRRQFMRVDEVSEQTVHARLAACDTAEALKTKLWRDTGRIDNLELWV